MKITKQKIKKKKNFLHRRDGKRGLTDGAGDRKPEWE